VIENCTFPSGGAVTLRAIGAESGIEVPWIIGRFIISLMTGIAVARCPGEYTAHMTLRATYPDVLSRQREGCCTMIKLSAIPINCAMTIVASGRELPCVRRFRGVIIILIMACKTLRRGFRIGTARMALRTRRRQVRSSQGKTCLVVIVYRLPISRRVACRAFRRESRRRMIRISRSIIIALMACVAIRWSAVVNAADMTLFTAHTDMRSGQRKSGCIVIKAGISPV
jgi:hypothetical protein